MRKLEKIEVPVPRVEIQQWFNGLERNAREVRLIRNQTAQDVDALIPALLHEVFNGMARAA